MDLKCFECINDEWSRLNGSGVGRDAAGEQAKAAITMMGGTALCATHATYAKANLKASITR
jgi:hypothetical protein